MFRKYAAYFAGVLCIALLGSGLLSLYFSYRDTRALVDELQIEKARDAAARIEQFVRTVESQVRGAAPAARASDLVDPTRQHLDLLMLMRLAPAVVGVAWIDPNGRERVRVSQVFGYQLDSRIDRSSDPAFLTAATGKVWYGPVYFDRDTEPRFKILVPGSSQKAGVVEAEVNLKLLWDVVSAIALANGGRAYVVDSKGRLIAHPDMARVLKLSDLSALAQVRAALERPGTGSTSTRTVVAKDERGRTTLVAHASVESADWRVIVEQPLTEAFAPVYASALRGALVIVLALVAALAASFLLARRMVEPIRTLERSVQRIGEGRLEETIEVTTGDELQRLADQFNRMTAKLRESYTGLERKVAERTRQLAEANNAKSRFLAAASHDLRQPVHALGLFVAQLQEVRDPAVAQRLIEKITASSVAVSELVDALLDISKLDAGGVESQSAEFALQPIFDRIEHAFALTAQAKDLRLRVRPNQLRVATDPVLFERILLNLVSNAIRYTRSGGVLVGARRRGIRTIIEVWDTGVGIAGEHLSRIFEEFYRLPESANEPSKGLGLGLAIVDRLARLLELPVEVASVEGRGSKFGVSVPPARAAAAAAPAAARMAAPTGLHGLRVLLIDDDGAARDAAEGLLTHWGCLVLTAASESEAHSLLRADQPAPGVIICDYHLGDAERGTEVVRRVRDRLSATVPAVLISGDVTTTLRNAAEAAGLYLLQKPLKAAKLRAVLHHVASVTNEAHGRPDPIVE